MRRKVKVVWLEDNQNNTYIRNRKTVQEKIEAKGYEAEFKEFKDFSSAENYISQSMERIDFFVSDYNLGNGQTGLDYLASIRNAKKYKEFFILYSNNNEETIQGYVIEKIQEKGIAQLSNFMIISLGDYSGQALKTEFGRSVNTCLSRWDELNALRGEYVVENLELELELKECLGYEDTDKITYEDLISEFFEKLKLIRNEETKDRSIHHKWSGLRTKRNTLAHSKEDFDDDGPFIINEKESISIYEKDIDRERKKLISDRNEVFKYFDKWKEKISK
ncbi:hypothetical protein ABVR74_09800 [Lactococcus lactis subsp. lactis]|uniref:hypothetical protein n=1 Tax=Lactococcus lactis TaxID=1358 RepID=UPI0022E3C0B7|nr:hypothetical protein [Lactococcus lactis]